MIFKWLSSIPQYGCTIVYLGFHQWLRGSRIHWQCGDPGLISRWGRSSREGNDNSLKYSCLGNPMEGGVWWATVHGSQRVRHDWAHTCTYLVKIKILNWYCQLANQKYYVNLSCLPHPYEHLILTLYISPAWLTKMIYYLACISFNPFFLLGYFSYHSVEVL